VDDPVTDATRSDATEEPDTDLAPPPDAATAATARDTPLPSIGLGTWQLTGEACVATVERALEAGYRHLDAAQLYDNERAVGEGLARADVPREAVVVATKVAPERLGPDELRASVHESRERLGVDTIDLLYVHWPRAAYDPATTIPALNDLVDAGVVDALGLSNFTPPLLADALDRTGHVLAHQVELHPLLPQGELLAHARRHGYALVAYSPLARGRALDLPAVRTVADRYDATPAQVCLAWCLRRGAVPIPKATGGHVAENYGALALADRLDEAAVGRIDALDRRERLVDPPSAPWNEGPSATND
jgi:2,5-diketo-D-gluconate reductase B